METSENRGEHIPELVVQPPEQVSTVSDQVPEGTRPRTFSSASNQSTSTYYTACESLPSSPTPLRTQNLFLATGSTDNSPIYLSPKTYLAIGKKSSNSSTVLQVAATETSCVTGAEQVPESPVPHINILPPTPPTNEVLSSSVTMEADSLPHYETEYEQHVRSNNLNYRDGHFVPSWSGKGIHTLFQSKSDENDFFAYKWHLGNGAHGSVSAVECPSRDGKPVLVVRKYIYGRTGRQLHAFMEEVKNSSPFKHKHLIQFVGTYATKDTKNLALLQYPVGRCTLTEFMEGTYKDSCEFKPYRTYLENFFKCLANAIAYIHQGPIKHMDIKPDNIIVKQNKENPYFSVIVSDFGLARRIQSHGHSHSDGSTGFTREYAAPELTPDPNLLQTQTHTRRTDIFSLGCVFAEMATIATSNYTLEAFRKHRRDQNLDIKDQRDYAEFSRNLPKVNVWLTNLESIWSSNLPNLDSWKQKLRLTQRMLKENPYERPKSQTLVEELDAEDCCSERLHDCNNFWGPGS
ncbi:kinase-like protein [Glonium stellatum]|uniref:Kinase-like protein n=1 Tax=Glonium stellatum TaxID=574774 RepID=A0A8E2JS66_9PEZI|nr:kinase-like protein [Glonium stellatum]